MQDFHHSSTGATTAGIVTGVVMLVVGGIGGYAIAHSNNGMMESNHTVSATSATKAADLRADLVALGVEHMSLTSQAVDAALDGTPNATAFGDSLYSNGTTIGKSVGSVYGPDAEKTFNSVWKLHLDEFVKYAVASKSGDEAGKQAALAAIDNGYTKPLAQYLAKANPNLPEATLEGALRDHVTMTAQMIDFHTAGNYTAEADKLKMANQHIEGIFSILANGIVKQYPDKF